MKHAAMTISDLEKEMQRLNMTARQLAAALGISRATVFRWRNGKKAIPQIARLAIKTLRKRRTEK